jgi:hypothetical protein
VRLSVRLSMHPEQCGEDYVINASVDHIWEEDHSHYGDVSSFSSLTNRQHPRGCCSCSGTVRSRRVVITKQNLVSDLEGATPRRLASPATAQFCLTIPMLGVHGT